MHPIGVPKKSWGTQWGSHLGTNHKNPKGNPNSVTSIGDLTQGPQKGTSNGV